MRLIEKSLQTVPATKRSPSGMASWTSGLGLGLGLGLELGLGFGLELDGFNLAIDIDWMLISKLSNVGIER